MAVFRIVMKRTTFNVKGMTCKACVKRIEDISFSGISDVSVDLVKNNVSVSYKDGDSLLGFKKAIVDMGYKVEGLSNAKQGLLYGLLPHVGCIGFLIASILGVTVLMNFFRPLLMNRNIFYYLIGLSIMFATISSVIYLRKNGLLHFDGVKRKAGYLSTMYGLTVGINLVLFFLVFPMTANAGNSPVEVLDTTQSFVIDVDIPCPGHAPLITNELKQVSGVQGVVYSFPSTFEVTYDSALVAQDEVLGIEVFDEYPATMIEDDFGSSSAKVETTGSAGSCGSVGCDGSCGAVKSTCTGSCGGCGI